MESLAILTISRDRASTLVLKRALFDNKECVRINESSILLKALDVNEEIGIQFLINKKIVDFNNINAFWYRRGKIKFEGQECLQELDKYNHCVSPYLDVLSSLQKYCQEELAALRKFIHTLLEGKKYSLGSFETADGNKLIFLQKAQEVGFLIPNTLITDNKVNLTRFYYDNNEKIITKPIGQMLSVETPEYGTIRTYTSMLSLGKIKLLPSNFSISLFQEYIKKKYELRVLYIKGQCYSMAIFSQNDNQTIVDYRKYNYKKPNRIVPYLLNGDFINKINKFMTTINLDIGVLDMLVSDRDEVIFLEVNPAGQFLDLSYNCNYALDMVIYKFLTGSHGTYSKNY